MATRSLPPAASDPIWFAYGFFCGYNQLNGLDFCAVLQRWQKSLLATMVSGFISPRKILNDQLVLQSNMSAADLGCGSGEWTIPLAETMESGKVYAVDLLEEPLSVIRGKARDRGLENIELVKSDIEGVIPRLLANSLDLVLMTNMLFQIKDKKAVFEEAKRILKPGGRVLLIEWNENAAIGPQSKVAKSDLEKLASESGFSVASRFSAGNFHYGLVLKKNK